MTTCTIARPVAEASPRARRRGLLDGCREHRDDVSLALVLAAAVYGIVSHTLHPIDSGDEMMRLAQNLAAHGSFANPFSVLATGPTAVNPPLYPFILAVFIRILHSPALVSAAAIAACTVANAFAATLLLRLSVVFYGDMVPGLFASLLWIPVMPDMPGWDTSYTVAGLLAFCLLTSSLSEAKRSFGRAAMGGALAGLLFLLNPSSLLVSLPWTGFLVWRAKPAWRSALAHGAIVVVVLSAFIVGWCGRNYHQLGAFVVRTNLGMTLYASNNDCAQSSMIRNELNGCYQTHHPNTSVKEAASLSSLGEARYDRIRTADAWKWISANPAKFLRLTTARAWQFWFPATETVHGSIDTADRHVAMSTRLQAWIAHQNRLAYGVWAITALSIPGFILMLRRKVTMTVFAAAALLVYPLLYYIVVSDIRYRYPVLWLSLLPAGYWLGDVAEGCSRMSAKTRSEG